MLKDLLLDIDYVTVEEKAQVRLFLKGGVFYDPDFNPYFYVQAEGSDVEERLSGFGRVEKMKKSLLGRDVQIFKLTVNHPSEVPRIRDEVKGLTGVVDIFEIGRAHV